MRIITCKLLLVGARWGRNLISQVGVKMEYLIGFGIGALIASSIIIYRHYKSELSYTLAIMKSDLTAVNMKIDSFLSKK